MIEHSTIESGTDNKTETVIPPTNSDEWEYENHYQFISYPICIHSNEGEISQIFKGLYAYYHTEKPLTNSIVFTIHRRNRNVLILKQTPHQTQLPPNTAVACHHTNSNQQGDNPLYTLSAAGKVIFRGSNSVETISFLEWFVINALVQKISTYTYMTFHASALSYNNTGVIFPASSGSGKTTISLALIAQGFQYFSDEVAIIDTEDFTLRPLPRGLAIQEKAFHLLQSLNKPPPSIGFYRQTSFLHFRYFNPSAYAFHQPDEKPIPVKHVLFLEKPTITQKTHLKKIPKAMAVSRLLSCSFAKHPLVEDTIANCIKLSQRTECYLLTGDNLQERVDAVLDLFHA